MVKSMRALFHMVFVSTIFSMLICLANESLSGALWSLGFGVFMGIGVNVLANKLSDKEEAVKSGN